MNIVNETIFALSTIEGKSGISVFRISGPEAKVVFSFFGIDKIPPARNAVLTPLVNPQTNDKIDIGLSIWFPGPASFTGEDVVEFHLHGSRAVIKEVSSLLSTIKNYRHANPGEFSMRAFENQKMDLTELEGLADLIDAETRMQQRMAMRQMSGELESLYESWRKSILSILARVEAYIDFPDEELPNNLISDFNSQAEGLLNSINNHIDDERGKIIREGFTAVILGAPNVGKSSLLNYLAKKDVAIVSDIAGTTRDTIEVHLDINGYPLTIIDTAGLRNGTETIEKEGIRRAIASADNANLKIIMFDASDNTMNKTSMSLIDDSSLVVFNKTDLQPPPASISGELKNITDTQINISVNADDGLDEFLLELGEILKENLTPGNSPIFTRERHRSNLIDTISHLKKFIAVINGDKNRSYPIELYAEDLRIAARSLGRITGKIDVEDILGEIFSSFCIGK